MVPHFIISPQGDVLEPEGYSYGLSKVMMSQIQGLSREYAARTVGVVGRYLNRVHVAKEDPRSVLEEDESAAVERIKGFFAGEGIPVINSKLANRPHDLRLVVPEDRSTAHAQQMVAMLRQFYQLCGSLGVGRRTAANPLELPGWHLVDLGLRATEWRDYGSRKAMPLANQGLRFRVYRRKPYLPLLEDPADCARMMTAAVIAYRCPETVIDVCIVLQENGCRWREAAWTNALGWSSMDFGAAVLTTNKRDKRRLAKKLTLAPEVHSRIIRRFEAAPHPTDRGATMMDHLRERALAGDEVSLREIPLFPNSRGSFHQHSTFTQHWFNPAMAKAKNADGTVGLKIRSDVSQRQPTTHWYRHASITDEILVETAPLREMEADELLDANRRLDIGKQIKAICVGVCEGFGLKTDQSERYAAALMRQLAEERQMVVVARRRARGASQRGRSDLPIGVPRLALSEAETLLLQLPTRDRVAP